MPGIFGSNWPTAVIERSAPAPCGSPELEAAFDEGGINLRVVDEVPIDNLGAVARLCQVDDVTWRHIVIFHDLGPGHLQQPSILKQPNNYVLLDDFSRYVIAWKLCTAMKADDNAASLVDAVELKDVLRDIQTNRTRVRTLIQKI